MSLNIDSPLGKILTKLLDLVVLQVLFVVTSIPVVTIGAGLSAMFAVCRKLRQEDVVPVTKTYFREFKACFGKATASWLILAPAAALLGISISYYYHAALALRIVPLVIAGVLLVLVWLAFVYVFPLIAWFDNGLRAHFRNAFVLSICHFWTTVVVTLLYAFVFLLAVPLLPIVLLIAFSGSAFYAGLCFEKVFAKYDPSAAPPAPESGEEQ